MTTINSSCSTYIDTSAQVEISITKTKQQATWLQQTLDHHTPLFEETGDCFASLFSWVPQGLESILGGIFNLGLTILFFTMLVFVVSKLFMTWFSHTRKIVSVQ